MLRPGGPVGLLRSPTRSGGRSRTTPPSAGLTATRSYFDRTPYVETDEAGRLEYAEHHHTIGDHVADVVGAGLVLERLIEPEWPEGGPNVWGGWGPVRGALLPGHRRSF